MGIIRGIIGLVVICFFAILMSRRRDLINKKIKNIIIMIVIQIILAFLFLKTSGGIAVLASISNFMSWLINQAMIGVEFVFGSMEYQGGFVFFFNVLAPLVFMSALIGILDYIKVLPFVMKWVGKGIHKITGVGELEGQFAISATLLGQPACYLTIDDRIPLISEKRMFTLAMSGTATVGANMLAAYMEIIDGQFVVVAVILNIFSAFIISSLINPYTQEDEIAEEIEHFGQTGQFTDEATNLKTDVNEEKENFFDMLGTAMGNGWNLAIIVAGSLMGFVALIGFLNNIFDSLIGINLTEIMGYVFSPFAYAIGIPQEDIIEAGSIMATKLFTNEIVGMNILSGLGNQVTDKTHAMISAYLCSFANFGTIGIVTGALRSIDKRQSSNISGMAIKLITGATLSSLLTATIIGLFY